MAVQTLSDQVAEEIRALLARRNMTKSALARTLHVSHTWVTNRLTGQREIGVNELERIAGALGVDPVELLNGRERDTGGCPVPTIRPVRPVRREVPRPVSAAPAPHPVNPRPAIVRRRPRAASAPTRDAA